jgi:hypothetical protein
MCVRSDGLDVETDVLAESFDNVSKVHAAAHSSEGRRC